MAVSAVTMSNFVPGLMLTASIDKTIKVWDVLGHKPRYVGTREMENDAIYTVCMVVHIACVGLFVRQFLFLSYVIHPFEFCAKPMMGTLRTMYVSGHFTSDLMIFPRRKLHVFILTINADSDSHDVESPSSSMWVRTL